MNSITKSVDDEAKYSDFPASYHSGTLMIPILVNTSGSSIPATPNMAHRLFTSSACTNHFKFSGSSASPNGSNPLSPGRLPSRYPGEAKPGSHWPFLASTLKDDDEEVFGLAGNTLPNFPEDPLRNLDFEVHGRKTASEACVVTVAI